MPASFLYKTVVSRNIAVKETSPSPDFSEYFVSDPRSGLPPPTNYNNWENSGDEIVYPNPYFNTNLNRETWQLGINTNTTKDILVETNSAGYPMKITYNKGTINQSIVEITYK